MLAPFIISISLYSGFIVLSLSINFSLINIVPTTLSLVNLSNAFSLSLFIIKSPSTYSLSPPYFFY